MKQSEIRKAAKGWWPEIIPLTTTQTDLMHIGDKSEPYYSRPYLLRQQLAAFEAGARWALARVREEMDRIEAEPAHDIVERVYEFVQVEQ